MRTVRWETLTSTHRSPRSRRRSCVWSAPRSTPAERLSRRDGRDGLVSGLQTHPRAEAEKNPAFVSRQPSFLNSTPSILSLVLSFVWDAGEWDEGKLHDKPRPQPFDFSRQSKAEGRLIGRDGARSVKSHLSLVFSFSHRFDGSFLTLNIYTRKNKKVISKCLLRFLRLWIVNDESVRFVVFVSSSSFSSAALSDWWHVLISQMYLSLSFLPKSISCLLLLSSAYTRTNARRDLSPSRTRMRGRGRVVTHVYAFIFWTAPSRSRRDTVSPRAERTTADESERLYLHSQTFPSACG